MISASDRSYIAFDSERCIATGGLSEVARSAKQLLDRRPNASLLIFDRETSAQIELDLRGSVEDVLSRLQTAVPKEAAPVDGAPTRGPGRPKLGVVAREITLLPRHWEWLAQQPGGASVTIRKLVEEARRAGAGADRKRQAKEAAYRFMSAMAGNEPHYEEAIRALFADDAGVFKNRIASWPADIGRHALELANRAFDSSAKDLPA